MPSDIHEEYEEGLESLGHVGTIFYKFYGMFSAKVNGDDCIVKFGRHTIDTSISVDIVRKIREYVREQREWIMEQAHDVHPAEARRRMWWIVEKIIEYDIFSSSQQKTIMIWLDICLEQTKEPTTP
jgi:hypothetical protein